jgi:hypothetical protein
MRDWVRGRCERLERWDRETERGSGGSGERERCREGAETSSSDRWTRESRELRSSMIGGWVTPARPGNPAMEEFRRTRGLKPSRSPQPATQTRRIRENPSDPILPEVRSSMSGGSNGDFWRARRLSGRSTKPEASDPKTRPVTRQTREEDPVLPLCFPAVPVAFSGGFAMRNPWGNF